MADDDGFKIPDHVRQDTYHYPSEEMKRLAGTIVSEIKRSSSPSFLKSFLTIMYTMLAKGLAVVVMLGIGVGLLNWLAPEVLPGLRRSAEGWGKSQMDNILGPVEGVPAALQGVPAVEIEKMEDHEIEESMTPSERASDMGAKGAAGVRRSVKKGIRKASPAAAKSALDRILDQTDDGEAKLEIDDVLRPEMEKRFASSIGKQPESLLDINSPVENSGNLETPTSTLTPTTDPSASGQSTSDQSGNGGGGFGGLEDDFDPTPSIASPSIP